MISDHLTEAEFTATGHRMWVAENPASFAADASAQANARNLLGPLFERARSILGVPLHCNSGFRCGGLNRDVGGRPTSRHVLGLAIDVVPIGLELHAAFRILAAAMRAGQFDADEIIIECGTWIHLQASPSPRRLALTSADGVHFEVVA